MNTQPNGVVCVLIAVLIHIAVACTALWHFDAEDVQFAEIVQGIEITLDSNAYRHILQEQQEKQQKSVKKEAIKQVKPKKQIVKKQTKAITIEKKEINEVLDPKIVVYQVEEQTVEKVEPVNESVVNVTKETIKVASATETSIHPQQVEEQQHGADGGSGTANQKPVDMNNSTRRYLAKLMRHLNRYKHYPAMLKKNHVEGKPVIRFSINKSGQVTQLEVKKHSKSAELDQAAMDVFRRASPLPKIPSELARETLTMSLPIEYSLIND